MGFGFQDFPQSRVLFLLQKKSSSGKVAIDRHELKGRLLAPEEVKVGAQAEAKLKHSEGLGPAEPGVFRHARPEKYLLRLQKGAMAAFEAFARILVEDGESATGFLESKAHEPKGLERNGRSVKSHAGRRDLRYPESVKLWFLLFSLLPAFADAPPWVRVQGTPHLPLEEWTKVSGFRSFADLSSGRVLLEKKGAPPLILLLGSRYALQGERFLELPEPPLGRDGKIFLSAGSGARLFPAVLPQEERARLALLLQSAGGMAETSAGPPKEAQAAKTPAKKASTAKSPEARAGAAAPPDSKTPAATRPGGECGRPVKRVFLDPGHGGDDSGTTHGSLKEKDIVLRFARFAAEELKRKGFEVSYSRTKDVFLPLDMRTKIAEKWKADIFISLHVNSSTHTAAHGTETYILSQEATDAEARRLALLENSIAETAKASESAVQDILWDMEQTAYLQESAYLASYVQGAIVANAHALLAQKKVPGDWRNRGVRQAPFYVLSRAPMPAILVELGYLSNPRDRRLLAQKFFQESLAKALAEGVKKYRESCRSN
jgi:N-acetylmuramoyl-L-alanine amidase